MLSHSSAAWLWGMTPKLTLPVEVVVPTQGHPRRSIRLHHALTIEADRARNEGLPVTTVPRTLLDFAASQPRRRLEQALDRTERLGLFDLPAIDALLARAGRHPGIGALRTAVDLHREPAFTRSGLERLFLGLVHRAGLPKPAMNLFVAGFELDAYWEAERFAVELDGYESHRGRRAFEADRVRQEELKLAGIEMIRLTSKRLDREPEAVAKRLAVLLERRRRELRRAAE
jgi:hypothetical protein